MTTGAPQDLVDILTSDHRTIEALFFELEQGGGDSRRQRDLIDVTIAELMAHAVAEEQYLYPAARRYLPEGDELADRELAEHREAERLMDDLMSTDVEHPEFAPLVIRLIREVRRHVQEEESMIFPQLRAECTPDTLVDLGTKVISAKKLAPTRPHPASPHRPPLNKVAAPITGLIDQAVDAFADRPTSVEEL